MVASCDELERLYGGENYEVSQAASYEVENWANHDFWQELIDVFKIFRERACSAMPISFWSFHNRTKQQHVAHTQAELE